jgi:hypothetical protein
LPEADAAVVAGAAAGTATGIVAAIGVVTMADAPSCGAAVVEAAVVLVVSDDDDVVDVAASSSAAVDFARGC